MRYRAEIDGLRAFAVVPVILFHAGIAGFGGGFVGVDVFFVISGYLITSILIEDMDKGRYSLLRFYERRARRILPALLFMIAVVTVIALFVLPPIEMMWYGQSVLATALFLSNVYFLLRGLDYFAGATAEYPLLHTWSLAVEEQFYILFPLLLWVCWRFGVPRILWIIGGLSALSLVGAEILSRSDQALNFYLLPSRIWELGAGALCALWHFQRPARPNQGLSLLGLGLLIGSVFLLTETLRFPSIYAIPPVLGTALVLLYADRDTAAGQFLSWRPFVWIGLASYSAYLWHQPLFAFAHVRYGADLGAPVMLGLSGLSILLGYGSLRFIETPFRRRGGRSALSVVMISSVALAGCAALGLFLHTSLGLPNRSAAPHLPADYYSASAKPIFPSRGVEGNACSVRCTMVAGPADAPKVLLIGDSHAQDIIPGMIDMATRQGWQLDLFINTGCSYTRATLDEPGCRGAQDRLQALDTSDYAQVLLMNRFSGMMLDLPEPDRLVAMQDYTDLILRLLDQGSKVTLFAPRAMIEDDPIRFGLANRIAQLKTKEDFAATPAWASVLSGVEGREGLQVIDQSSFFNALACGDPSCFHAHTPEGLPLYRDRHHLSRFAAGQLVGRIEQVLADLNA